MAPQRPENKFFQNLFSIFTNLGPFRKMVDQIRLVLRFLGCPALGPQEFCSGPFELPPEEEILRPPMGPPRFRRHSGGGGRPSAVDMRREEDGETKWTVEIWMIVWTTEQ